MSSRGRPNVSLYVRGISDNSRPEDLRDVFERYGRVRDIYIPLDYYTRRPRGFAYVEYEDVRDAEDAMYDSQGLRLHGRTLEVEFAIGDRKSPTAMRSKYGAPGDRSPRRRGSRSRDRDRSSRRRRRSYSRSRSRSPRRHRRRRSESEERSRSGSPRRESRSRSKSVEAPPEATESNGTEQAEYDE